LQPRERRIRTERSSWALSGSDTVLSMVLLAEVFAELFRRHQKLGAHVVGGFSPHIAPLGFSRSNLVIRDGECLSTSGSISDSEMSLVFGICEIVKPKRVLVIGNSYGLSTAFFALANPQAEVVAFDKYRVKGLEFTRELCAGLCVTAIEASTPEDLTKVVGDHLGGEVDLVFVDAVHENDVQTAEFRILAPLLSEGGTVVFHDVLSSNLLDSFSLLKHEFPSFAFRVLAKSHSGLGVATRFESELLADYLTYFESSPSAVSRSERMFGSELVDGLARLMGVGDLGATYRTRPHPQT